MYICSRDQAKDLIPEAHSILEPFYKMHTHHHGYKAKKLEISKVILKPDEFITKVEGVYHNQIEQASII